MLQNNLLRTMIFTCCTLVAISTQARAEVSKVVLAKQQTLAFLPAIVMEHEKLLEKHLKEAGLGNVPVTWATFAGGNTAIDAMLSGSLQFAFTGITPFITLWAKTVGTNQAIKGVAALSAQPEYINTRDPNVKSLRDFTDKNKIAVPAVKVSTQAVFLQMAAAKLYGDSNYTKLDRFTVSMSQPDATTAVLSGKSEVDTAFVSQPFTFILQKSPEIHTIFNSFDMLGGPATLTMVWASTRFHDQNPKTYAAFLAAYTEAIQLVNTNKEEAAKIYLAASGDKLPIKDIVSILSDPQVTYSMTPQNVMKSVDFMHRIGTIKGNPPASWKDLWFSNIHNLAGS
ncbi:MAG: ABC transporter substrate-binding protein [Paralcaligenes sp.]